MNNIKIIMIHGNGGPGKDNHWFPWLRNELTKLGVNFICENMPDPYDARCDIWLPYIASLGADEKTILIGHSSGGVASLRYAQSAKILGSIVVGVNHTDLGDPNEKISGYYDHPWDWESIKNNQKWIVQFDSTDDPYIPIEEPRHIHKMLQTEYYEFTDRGHFGSPHGEIMEFPEILEVIKKKLNLTSESQAL